jgi:tetratricopeptide (TPR) repeat protein
MNRKQRRQAKKQHTHKNPGALGETDRLAFQTALAAHQAGDVAPALHRYREILERYPKHADTLALAGIATCQSGRLEDGIAYLQAAVKIRPESLDAQYNLAYALESTGRFEEAAVAYRMAIGIDPGNIDAHFNLGNVLHELDRPAEAAEHYRRVIALRPDYANAYGNLGNVLNEAGELTEAESAIRKAIALQGESAAFLSNLGTVLKEQNRLDDAADAHRRALELDPNYAEGHGNYGNTLAQQGRLAEAIERFERALALKPDLIDVRSNYALALLKHGRFQDGWREYKTRWQWNGFEKSVPRPFEQTRWHGESLDGKSILVWGEQGIGDELMFAGMFPDLLAQAASVTVECERRLVPVFERSFPGITAYARATPPDTALTGPDIDFQIPCGDLGAYLRPNLSSFPEHSGYIKPNLHDAERLRRKYRDIGNGAFIVGLSWKSGNQFVGEKRSAGLDLWAPVLTCPGCFFVNLQYGKVKPFLDVFKRETGIGIYCDAEIDPLTNMDIFLAQLAAVDLVISIDNSTVHAAGALGMPVWTLLSAAPDWRWLQNADISYWYPSMRLIRQEKLGTWESVFETAGNDLRNLVQQRRTS